MNPLQPRASWVALGSGKILSLGGPDNSSPQGSCHVEMIDCRGRTLVPGFIDSHIHLLSLAESFVTLDLRPECGTRSIADIQSKIRALSEVTPRGAWIRGRGYNEFHLMEKRHPVRRDLDEAAPDHPVKLTHRSGHAHVLNTLALKRTGIAMETPEPPGGIIDRDLDTGLPSGLLYEMGELLSMYIPPLEISEVEKGMKLANRELVSSGITTLHDASFHNDEKRWALFRSYKDRGLLDPRLDMMFGFRSFHKKERNGPMTHRNPNQLRVKGVKILLDETTGRLYPSQQELDEMVFRVHQSGMQAAIHAIEENAIESACNAIEKAFERLPRADHRHRIEHCSVCPPSLTKRIADMGVVVVSQPAFIYYHGDRYLKTVEDRQIEHLYPFGSLIRAGIRMAGSSDCPYAPLNPFSAMSAAVSRKTQSNEWINRSEGVPVMDALRMYTEFGAYAAFSEGEKGSISPGKLADLVLLERDPTTTPPDEIKDIKVEMTVIDGNIVWDRRP